MHKYQHKIIGLNEHIDLVREQCNDWKSATVLNCIKQKDEDFAYLQGSEAQRMWEIGESLYNINQSRLKRYAKRRGLNYNSAV